MKRLYILFIVVIVAISSYAEESIYIEIEGITYRIYPEAATAAVYKGDESITTAVIPASVNYNKMDYPVTSISSLAFDSCRGLTSVEIPNSVISIGSYAFSVCSGLISVTIPNSVTSIGIGAFSYCTGLTLVEIPNSLTSIDKDAFFGCSSLISVTIPNSVTSIGIGAFSYCSGLTSMEIPNSVTSIGTRAFSDCSGLKEVIISDSSDILSFGSNVFDETSIETLYLGRNFECTASTASDYPFYNKPSLTKLTISNSVTEICNNAFSVCSGLTTLIIPNSVTSIGDEAFSVCSGLTTLIIPNSVTSIGDKAFSVCSGLTTLIIPNSVTSIGNEAFSDCTGLTSITIPNSVISIGSRAFRCNLKELVIADGNETLSFGGSAFGEIETLYLGRNFECTASIASYYTFYNKPSLTKLTIGNSVTSIGDEAFSDCTSLKEVIISDGSEDLSFGSNVFDETSIKTLYLGRNVKCTASTAFYYPFYNQTRLTNLTIGNSVTEISFSAFSHCGGLTTVTIPNSVTRIDDFAFEGCIDLKEVIISDGSEKLSFGLEVFDMTNIETLYLGRNMKYQSVVDEIDIPFYRKTKLTNLTIGNSVTEIGNKAFYGCSGLTSVNIPHSVTSIGQEAFSGCSRLKEVIIEDGSEILSFAGSVFEDTNFETLYLGRNFECSAYTATSDYPFYNKTSLTKITIGNSVIEIGEAAFFGCSGLTSVTIPNSVTEIGERAFYSCSGLTSITISNSVTEIGERAFYSCSGLTSITIPNSVNSIDHEAFKNCSGLKELIIADGSETLLFKRSVFEDTSIETLYVGRDFEWSLSPYPTDYYALPFYYKTSLTTLTIGNMVNKICWYAFWGCSGIKSVTIPNSVVEIDPRAFKGCSGLKEVIIADGSETLDFQGGVFQDTNIESLYLGRNWIYETTTADYTFYELASLTTLTIGNMVTEIGNKVFAGLTGLTSLTIPNSVTSIGYRSFYDCSGLTSVTIGNSVTDIGEEAFSGCSSLTSVNIGNSVIEIGKGAFSNCDAINSVFITDLEAWCRIIFPSDITTANPLWTGADMYLNGNKVVNLEIPSSIKFLQFSTFAGCRSIETVKFPEGFRSVTGDRNFQDCNNLKKVYLPSSTIEIKGIFNFGWCPSLDTFYCYAVIPPSARQDYDIFEGSNIENMTLHVPEGTKEKYAISDTWKDFGRIIDDLPSSNGVEEIITDSSDGSIEIYDLQGICTTVSNKDELDSLAPGIYILRQGNKTKKITIK